MTGGDPPTATDWSAIENAVPPSTASREVFRVRIRETVAGGAVSLAALADMCQDAADRNAATFGMGLRHTMARGPVWVLARMRLSMRRYPVYGQSVTVETWPSGIERRRAMRDFRLSTSENGVIGVVATSWSLFDLSARRPRGMVPEVARSLPRPGPRLLALGESIVAEPQALMADGAVGVRPADIDLYGHVNNTHLVAWVLGGAYGVVEAPFCPEDMNVAFRSECRLDDRPRIRRGGVGGDGMLSIALCRADGGPDIVRARVRYGPG